jgi:hypothetical protein
MEIIRCPHGLEINLPTILKEFLDERFHENIEELHTHLTEFPNCAFESHAIHDIPTYCICDHALEYHSSNGCFAKYCSCRLENWSKK